MHVIKMSPDLRNHIIRVGKNSKGDTNCHDNQTDTEQRVNLADNFINGNITYVEPKLNPEDLFAYTNMFYECKEIDLLSTLKNMDHYQSALNDKSGTKASLLSGRRIYQYVGGK